MKEARCTGVSTPLKGRTTHNSQESEFHPPKPEYEPYFTSGSLSTAAKHFIHIQREDVAPAVTVHGNPRTTDILCSCCLGFVC